MKPVVVRPADDATEEKDAGDSTGSAQPVEERRIDMSQQSSGGGMTRAKQSFSTWDFILLSVAALVAYELGRGTGVSKATQPTIPPPDAA